MRLALLFSYSQNWRPCPGNQGVLCCTAQTRGRLALLSAVAREGQTNLAILKSSGLCLYSFCTSTTWPLTIAQTRDILMAFDGNMGQGHGPRPLLHDHISRHGPE